MTDGEGGAESIGSRLLRLRRERGLTQLQLAQPRYTHAYVSSVEAGRRRPSEEGTRFLAERLGVSYEELAYGRPPELEGELEAGLDEARRVLSSGGTEEAAHAYARTEQQAAGYGLTALRAEARAGQGEVALHRGDVREAAARFLAAGELRRDGPLARRVSYVARRAHCLFLLGELDEALELLESTLARLRPPGATDSEDDPEAEMLLQTELILPYFEIGSHARAARAATRAMELASRASVPERIAAARLNAGRVLLEQDRVEEAEAAIRAAAETFDSLGFDSERTRCQWSLGFVLLRTGRAERAAEELEAARTSAERTGDRETVMGTSVELAEASYRLGSLEDAEEWAARAAELSRELEALATMAQSRRVQGRVARDRGEPERAESFLDEAVLLYERAGARLEVAVTSQCFGDLLMDRGRTSHATAIYRHGLTAAEATA